MTATQVAERRIVNELLGKGPVVDRAPGTHPWADRLIRGLSAAAVLLIVGSWSPGALALGLGAATVWVLGIR